MEEKKLTTKGIEKLIMPGIGELTIQQALVIFKHVWQNILKTKKRDKTVDKLALFLKGFKELDLLTPEEMQYFEFALLYAHYLEICENRLEEIVKKELKEVSK